MDKSPAGELFRLLPKDIQENIIIDVAEFIGQLIIDQAAVKHPILTDRELFGRIMGLVVVSMSRTHPRNDDTTDQMELLDDIMNEVEKRNKDLPYFTRSMDENL
jgi:hypothetical protein